MLNNIDIKYFLRVFLITSIVLPAGTVVGIPFKILSLVLLLAMMLCYQRGVMIHKFFYYNVAIIIFILFEALYTLCNSILPPMLVFAQGKDIFIYFLMFTICLCFNEEKNIYLYLINTVTVALATVGAMKLLIILASVATGMSVSVIVKAISELFNVALMTYDLNDSAVARINMPSDSLILIPVYYLITKFIKGGANRKDVICFVLIAFSALITMSRYQWASAGLAILLAILSNLKSKKIVLACCCIALLSFVILSLDSVQEAIQMRFSTQTSTYSDSVRLMQEVKIIAAINNAPIFGNGLGYYIPDLIRNSISLYAYELQIPALVMQLGFFGASVIIFMTMLPIFVSSLNIKFSNMLSVWVLAIAWITAAFFNPVLFSSSGGAGLVALYSLSASGIYRKS